MRWSSPRCAWHTFATLRSQPQENNNGQHNPPRLAGNDRRHADIRDDRLVCAGVRATGARRGVLALRVRRRHVAVGLRRVRLSAAGNADPYNVSAGGAQWNGDCRQLGAAVRILFPRLDCHWYGGLQRTAIHAGRSGGTVSRRENYPAEAVLAGDLVHGHAGDRQRPWHAR